MRQIILIVLVLGALAGAAVAHVMLPWPGTATSSGGGGCTNKLDFSVACNSQYSGIVGL